MTFVSANFLLFLLVVFFSVKLVFREAGAKKSFLVVVSYLFYMTWEWRFGFFLLAITCVQYWCAAMITKNAALPYVKRRYLALAITFNLGALGYFKYAGFFLESFLSFVGWLGIPLHVELAKIVLPIGISFFTFQSLGYVVDVYRGAFQHKPGIRDFALYVAFFPQLLSGPISRASLLLTQIRGNRLTSNVGEMEREGFLLLVRGYVKKIVFADMLGTHLVNPAFHTPTEFSPVFLLIGVFAYSFQIYMDLSGYTDIARGTAKLLGYNLANNFERPYLATSISNFWQRWHMSMSSFFRDYLFHSLGGSRSGNVYINLLITFVAIGLWHGSGWTFVLYGLLHGLMVSAERYGRGLGLGPLHTMPLSGTSRWFLRVTIVFFVVSLARVLFRAPSLSEAGEYFQSLFNFSTTYAPFTWQGLSALVLAWVLHFVPSGWYERLGNRLLGTPTFVQAGAVVAIVYCLVAIGNDQLPFVYFEF